MSDSANKTLTEAEKVFKALIWDPLIIAGEKWLEVEVPFLALPVIKNLGEFAVTELSDALFDQLILFIDVSVIRLSNTALQHKWERAAESLAIISREHGADSDEYKTALAQASADFAKWIHTGP